MPHLPNHLDATERSGMFEALEHAAAQVGLAVFVVHVDASPPTITYASELLAHFVGRAVEDVVGHPPWELVASEQRARVRDIIANRGPGAPPITLEFEIERPDGGRREVDVGVARITTPGAELAVCYFRDTTDERRAVRALRQSEGRFRSLVEHAPDAVVIVQEGRIALANPVAVSMFGETSIDGVRGRLLSEFLSPDDAARARERIAKIGAGSDLGTSEYRVLPRDIVGEVHSIPYEYNEKPAVLAFVRDVTERKRMQQELFRADRLASIGTMAATVAHEINNPLTYLQLSLQRLEHAVDALDPDHTGSLREHIADALHGAERVARIVHDLRVHARDEPAEHPTSVSVVAVVERALKMVEHDLRHRAQLVRRYSDKPATVEVVAGRLEQVLINVLVNAIQAIDGADSSRDQITVEIEVAGDVRISVTDTGTGISDRERVFEPFFTTKPIGQGTGLGLSVCKQIVEGMRGRIEIESSVGVGTKIVIILPLAPEPPRESQERARSVSGERLRILVIDDDALVRKITRMSLALHHDVEEADGGEPALTMLRKTRFDVILCDLMMPRLNGRDVYERIREQSPGLERRIVFITGGATIPALAGFLESVENLKLLKPFALERALEIVQATHARA